MELAMANGFFELSQDEMMVVDGGDPARNRMLQERREAGVTLGSTEESEKLAISYTLGYLSLATCWCTPLSFALGLAGLLYSCDQ